MPIKPLMYLFFLYGAECCDLDAGKIHNLGHYKGWALKIETFWSQNGTHFAQLSMPSPYNARCYGCCPHPNYNVLPHINNRYINSYYTQLCHSFEFLATTLGLVGLDRRFL
jgi:hypothetical protein